MTANAHEPAGGDSETPASPCLVKTGSCRRHARHRYLFAGLLLMAAVAAGSVLGAAGTVLYFERRNFPAPPSPDDVREAMLKRLGDAFPLAPDEADRLDGIIRRRVERMGEIRRSSFAEIRGEIEAMREEVGACLGPERFRAWDEMEKERWRRLRERTGPPSRHSRRRDHCGGN